MDMRNWNATPRDRVDGVLLRRTLADAEAEDGRLSRIPGRARPARNGSRINTNRAARMTGAEADVPDPISEDENDENGAAECCDALSGCPLAMAYIPEQHWRALYDDEEALCHGTLFRELDFPFCPGCTGGR